MSKKGTLKEKVARIELVLFGDEERHIIGFLEEWNALKQRVNVFLAFGSTLVIIAAILKTLYYFTKLKGG